MYIGKDPETKSCLKCKTKKTRRWQSGPDGLKTLCSHCHCEYRKRRIVIYKNRKGICSVLNKKGTKPAKIVGFGTKQSGRNNFLMPLTEFVDPPAEKKVLKDTDDEIISQAEPADVSCLRCREVCRDPRLGPDGQKTLCLPCHRRYICRELPLYKDSSGSITVSCVVGGYRVDHVGFHLKGMQRDLTRPITKPWLGKARETATILTTRTLQCRIRDVSRQHHMPFKFQTVQRRQNTFATGTSPFSSVRNGPVSSPRVKEEAATVPQHRLIPGSNRGYQKISNTVLTSSDGFNIDYKAGSAPSRIIDASLLKDRTTASRGRSWTLDRHHPRDTSVRSGVAVKASCRISGSVVTRRFSLNPDRQPEYFIEDVRHIFGLQSDFYIRYKDSANDEITASTRMEISELFAIALESTVSPVVIEVILISDGLPFNHPTRGFLSMSHSDLGRKKCRILAAG